MQDLGEHTLQSPSVYRYIARSLTSRYSTIPLYSFVLLFHSFPPSVTSHLTFSNRSKYHHLKFANFQILESILPLTHQHLPNVNLSSVLPFGFSAPKYLPWTDKTKVIRAEERRVGKECRYRW